MIAARFVTCRWGSNRGVTYNPFRASYPQTLDLLERELFHLRAKDIVIQAGFERDQIRNDGMPYNNATPRLHNGVILSFQTKRGPLAFPCYRYLDWRANLRAIALSLEALRAVDRYGVTQKAEQYAGWTQIEAPKDGFVDALAAALFIADQSGADAHNRDKLANLILGSAEYRKRAYLDAAKRLHPDGGGSHDDFVRLQNAMRLLGEQRAGA
jgi:hypothetical protein